MTSTTAEEDAESKDLEDIHLSFGGHLFLNWSNPVVEKEMLDVFRFWIRLGVDGFYLKNVHLIQVRVIEDIYTILSDILTAVDPVATDSIKRNNKDSTKVSQGEQSMGFRNNNDMRQASVSSSSVSVEDRVSSSQTDSENQSSSDKKTRRILMASRSCLQLLQHRHQYEAEYFSVSSLSSLSSSTIQQEAVQVSSSSVDSKQEQERPLVSRASSTKSLLHSSVIWPRIPSAQPLSLTGLPHRDVYSYFHLIDTFLDLKMNQTEELRDRVNEMFLNEPESHPWILWNLGSVTSSRLVTRIGHDLMTAVSFLLFMMPGSISILYGDEIGLRPAVHVDSKKVSTHSCLVLSKLFEEENDKPFFLCITLVSILFVLYLL